MASDLRWFMRPRRVVDGRCLGVRCDRRPRVQDFVSAGGAILAVAGLRWLRRPHPVVAATTVSSLAVDVKISGGAQVGVDLRWLVLVYGRGVGVRCDRCPRVQDAVSGGGAIPAVSGLRWLRRPHSVVAATTVSLLAVDVKVSAVLLLGLREN